MTKQELFLELSKEAGTYTGGDMSPEEWYDECFHNLTPDQDQDLTMAANGNIAALVSCRQFMGLPIFT